MEQAATLSQVTSYLREIVDEAAIKTWIVAEVNTISFNRHCYLECIEKAEDSGEVIAKMKMNIWGQVASRIIPQFEQVTGHQLAAGMKIMVYATVSFHDVYGVSATISAINPEYTLGDLEKLRRETIKRLTDDGVIDMNKQLELPTVIQKIAVVSSETAAGYGDFCQQLNNNQYGLSYDVKLYPALVQGNEAPSSVIAALDSIMADVTDNVFVPDVVVIIRGGGSRSDLLCFDDYDMASNIAQFPLPVITGIGHDRDESVADIVAHTKVKTPTAAAEFLIAHNSETLYRLDEMLQTLRSLVVQRSEERKQKILTLHLRLVGCTKDRLMRIEKQASGLLSQLRIVVANRQKTEQLAIEHSELLLRQAAYNRLRDEFNRVDSLAQKIEMFNPKDVMKRGFTITSKNGKKITSASEVCRGDKLTTITADGKIFSVVE
ncbi:MAG: exodeoxyribonuclease VII large subunit [Bacteroidales bacterium]|nr:exodeoxyribonuclease VII large subunit [Bacteroidales bacterium]